MLGYDALSALLHGSEQVLSTKKTINASDLTQELKRVAGANEVQGITGRIAFDSYGNQDQSKMIFVEHIDGTNLVIDEKHGCLFGNNCGS
jgi:ABC-type branched-subunit amino acid transport system substrate-binding protein